MLLNLLNLLANIKLASYFFLVCLLLKSIMDQVNWLTSYTADYLVSLISWQYPMQNLKPRTVKRELLRYQQDLLGSVGLEGISLYHQPVKYWSTYWLLGIIFYKYLSPWVRLIKSEIPN